MSTRQQLIENLASANTSGIHTLLPAEKDLIDEVEAIYNQRAGIPCSACRYCMPCPNGVDIPASFRFYNEASAYDYFEESKRVYNLFAGQPAKNCIQCGLCDPKCPQGIDISGWMPKIHAALAG
jgi:predicted aldo/keto reductase-like oxidoreductase